MIVRAAALRSEPLSDDQNTDRAEQALTVLRQALGDPIVEVRREAALALGRLGDEGSAEALARALASDSEPVRRAAALALGKIPGAAVSEALLAALRGDVSVWREAAVALSRHHEPEVIAGLTDLLADSEVNEHTRRGAALALGALLAEEPLEARTVVGPPVFEDEQGRLHVML
jgi:HEAT repeat protein